jgi:hypothetical protein
MKNSIPRTFAIGLFLFMLAPLRQDAHALPTGIHPIVRVQGIVRSVYARLQNNSTISGVGSEVQGDVLKSTAPARDSWDYLEQALAIRVRVP